MRRKTKTKRVPEPDLAYNSTKVEKFVNYVMERGKKNVARQIFYDALGIVEEKINQQLPLMF